MKKIMIYNFWFIIIAWTLMLYHHPYLAIGVCYIELLYNYYIYKKINLWRLSFIYLLLTVFTIFLANKSSLPIMFTGFIPFLVIVNLNNVILNEVFYLSNIKKMNNIYIYLAITTFAALIMALIMPEHPFDQNLKYDILTAVFLIFFPSFIEMSICLASKHLRRIEIKKAIKTN